MERTPKQCIIFDEDMYDDEFLRERRLLEQRLDTGAQVVGSVVGSDNYTDGKHEIRSRLVGDGTCCCGIACVCGLPGRRSRAG